MKFVMTFLTIFFWVFMANAAVNVTVAGTSYSIPNAEGEEGWADNVTAWMQAISANSIYLSGGTFTLTAELDLGDTYGILAPYYKPETGTPASTGLLRLAEDDTIAWRNEADDGDVVLSKDNSDNLEIDSVDILTASNTVTVTNKSIDADSNTLTNIENADIKAGAAIAYSKLSLSDSVVNADVNSAAAIAYSKLNLTGSILNADVDASAAIAHDKMAALTASRAMTTDGSGFASASSVTSTELGYLSGVTSALQTQIDSKATKESSSTDLAIVRFDGTGGALDDSLVTISDTGLLTMTVNDVKLQNQKGIQFWEPNGAGSEYVRLVAPDTLGSTIQFKLPNADGSNGQAIVTNGSGDLSFATPGNSIAVVSKTTTYTATTSDDLILADTSGGAWTLTLPTAVGNDGKRFWIKYTDSNFTYALTVDGDGTETVGGSTTTTLNTQDEMLLIVSDGSNWQIMDRRIPSKTIAYTPTTQGFGTVSGMTAQWRRVGDSIHIHARFTCGTTTAVTAYVSLPSGLSIASGVATETAVGHGGYSGTSGQDLLVLAGASNGYVTFAAHDASAAGLNSQQGSAIASSSLDISFFATVPVTGWNP